MDHPARVVDDRWPDDLSLRILAVGSIEDPDPGRVHPFRLPWVLVVRPVNGRCELRSATTRVTVVPGAVLIAPPRVPFALIHHAAADGSPPSMRFAHLGATLWGGIDVFDLLDLPDQLTGVAARRAAAEIDGLLRTDDAPHPLARQARWKQAGFVLVETLTSAGTLKPGSGPMLVGAEQLAPVLAVLRDRLHEPLDVAGLATLANMSRASLHRRFLEAFGMPPMTYVRGLRLDEGARRLVRTRDSVSSIAAAVGYRDPERFARGFAARFGSPPTAYRTTGLVAAASRD